MALDLARGQRAAGSRVIAVSLARADAKGSTLAAEFADGGIAVHTIPKRDGFDPSLPLRLALLFRNERVDVVHTHNPQPLIYCAPAARLTGAILVHTKHGANLDTTRRLFLRRAAASLAHAYVAVSSTTAAVARKAREVGEARLHTIANGIDLSRFHPDKDARAAVRAELGMNDSVWLTGTVGRLAPEKDQALLMTALAPTLGERSQLVIVGDGPEAAALAALAELLGVRRFVHLPGARRDVPRVLAALDVFALSSRSEGLPLVIPEAMATALPVISTAVGGIPEVVEEGVTGFLTPARDAASLGERLNRLFADRARAVEMGQRGRTLALERYSAERMVGDYLALYDRLLRAR